MAIRSAAVLGAGTMGAQIAAHLANAGVSTILLDLTADAARDGLKRARTLKPDPFFTPDTAGLISTGSFDDIARVETAYQFSEAAHHGQFRASGDPYISHPLAVANILAQLHLDSQALSAALLPATKGHAVIFPV